MHFHAIRHKPTGQLMPARITRSASRGWTHWNPNRPHAEQSRAPRLFDTERAANNAVTQWLKGPVVWKHYGDPIDGDVKLVHQIKPWRRAEDVEVVPVDVEVPLP